MQRSTALYNQKFKKSQWNTTGGPWKNGESCFTKIIFWRKMKNESDTRQGRTRL